MVPRPEVMELPVSHTDDPQERHWVRFDNRWTAAVAAGAERPRLSGPDARRHPAPGGARRYSAPSHSRIAGVTISGACVCGPWPMPGSTMSVSGASTQRQVSLRVPDMNGRLSLP